MRHSPNSRLAALAALAFTATIALAQGFPSPKEGTWIARDFRFHTGEVMPELRDAPRRGR